MESSPVVDMYPYPQTATHISILDELTSSLIHSLPHKPHIIGLWKRPNESWGQRIHTRHFGDKRLVIAREDLVERRANCSRMAGGSCSAVVTTDEGHGNPNSRLDPERDAIGMPENFENHACIDSDLEVILDHVPPIHPERGQISWPDFTGNLQQCAHDRVRLVDALTHSRRKRPVNQLIHANHGGVDCSGYPKLKFGVHRIVGVVLLASFDSRVCFVYLGSHCAFIVLVAENHDIDVRLGILGTTDCSGRECAVIGNALSNLWIRNLEQDGCRTSSQSNAFSCNFLQLFDCQRGFSLGKRFLVYGDAKGAVRRGFLHVV